MSELWLGERVRPAQARPVVRRVSERPTPELAEERLKRLVELRHEGVGQILDWGRDKRGQLFVLREEVPGEPFLAYAERRRPDAETRLRLYAEVGEALRAAHRMGITHGQVSLRKVIVVEREGRPQAMLAGFEKGGRSIQFGPEADLKALEALAADFAEPPPKRERRRPWHRFSFLRFRFE